MWSRLGTTRNLQTRAAHDSLEAALQAAQRAGQVIPCRAAGAPHWWISEAVDDRRKAVAACTHCPVKAQCLATAEANREPANVWGGVDFTPTPLDPATVCIVEGCGRPRVARERCHGHYKRFRAELKSRGEWHAPTPEPAEPADPAKQCAAEGCNRPSRARGVCWTHYQRQRRRAAK